MPFLLKTRIEKAFMKCFLNIPKTIERFISFMKGSLLILLKVKFHLHE